MQEPGQEQTRALKVKKYRELIKELVEEKERLHRENLFPGLISSKLTIKTISELLIELVWHIMDREGDQWISKTELKRKEPGSAWTHKSFYFNQSDLFT